MIVREDADRLVLITQPDHAQLSRRVMERCGALQDHPRRRSILLVIGEHDNGWAEPDAVPEVDPASGAIFDFVTAPLRVRHGVWPRGVARLAHDPWAAALVAQHAITVYDRYRPDGAWTAFFAEMESRRDALLRASGRSVPDLAADYVFVRLGDLISLLFCTGSSEHHRVGAWSLSLTGSRVEISPDPFRGQTIPMKVEARELAPGPFDSDAALREAIAVATPTVLRGEAGA